MVDGAQQGRYPFVPAGLNADGYMDFFLGRDTASDKDVVQASDGSLIRLGHASYEPPTWDRVNMATGNITTIAEILQKWIGMFNGTLNLMGLWRNRRSFGELPLNKAIDLTRRLGNAGWLGQAFGANSLSLGEVTATVGRPDARTFPSFYSLTLAFEEAPPLFAGYRMIDMEFNPTWYWVLGNLLGDTNRLRHYGFDAKPEVAFIARALQSLAQYVGLAPAYDGTVIRAPEEHPLSRLLAPTATSDHRVVPALEGIRSVEVSGRAMMSGALMVELTARDAGLFDLFHLTSDSVPAHPQGQGIRWNVNPAEQNELPTRYAIVDFLSRLFGGNQELASPNNGGSDFDTTYQRKSSRRCWLIQCHKKGRRKKGRRCEDGFRTPNGWRSYRNQPRRNCLCTNKQYLSTSPWSSYIPITHCHHGVVK